MFDKIVFISDQGATIKLKDSENITMNLMNLHLVFEDEAKKILGEVNDVNGDTLNASFLGEIVGTRFLGGTIRKPRLDAKIRVINNDEIQLITGKDEHGFMRLGNTPYYEGASVFLDVNSFFSSHFAIFGNSGSGKSCGISRLFQNMFRDQKLNPFNANIIMLDSSGEYYNAFSNLNSINPNYHYRFISTNEKNPGSDKLRIPIYLLNVDDLALLLQVTNHSQIPIVESMKKLALVFSQKDIDANNYKNHLIAKAIMTILYTNETAPNKRNEVFSVLASCSTPQFNLEAVVQGVGYTRKFRECFLIDNSGNFTESVLLTEYVSSFIDEKLDAYEPRDGAYYTLDTLEKALNFTLISEGWLRNKNTYGDSVTLKVRLHSLIVSKNAAFFDVKDYMTIEQYLQSLVNVDGKKCQFVNINLDDVDDSFAKVITKIMSRLIFDYSKSLVQRASNPFHIVVEEAHRYIQNDNDRFLLGYNIFERIAKEGRKYGVILGIITQRPVELSDTVISQCSNFLIFKMNHPVDVEYIRKMVPNISDEIVEKQKTLQAGTCLGFGSAFRIPMIVRMDMPDPAPWSGNCDVVSFWGSDSAVAMSTSSLSSIDNSVVAIPGMTNPAGLSAMSSDSQNVKSINDLVSLNKGSETGLQAGEFGLLNAANETDDLSSGEEPKMPVTDTGINLVSLSNGASLGNGSVSGDTLSMSQMPSGIENSSMGNISSLSSSSGEKNVSSPKPLVSFLGGESVTPTQSSTETMSMTNNDSELNQSLQTSGIPNLVSFNNTSQINDILTTNNNDSVLTNMNSSGISEISSVPNNLVAMTGTDNNVSGIMPESVTNTGNFISTGINENFDKSNIVSFTSDMSNMNNSVNDAMSVVPGLQLVSMLNKNNLSSNETSNPISSMNNAFGNTDFPNIDNSSNLNSNIGTGNFSTSQGNGFISNVPSDMKLSGGNIGDDGESGVSSTQVKFTSGDALVNYIENMS